MKHPVDQLLQSYLDDILPPWQKREVREHVENCPSCHRILQIYRSLYKHMQIDVTGPLPKRFPSEVTHVVKKTALGSVHMNLWHIFMLLFFLIIAVNTALYYYDFAPLLSDMRADFFSCFTAIRTGLTRMAGSAGPLAAEFKIVVSAVLVFGLIILIDFLFLRPRHKTLTYLP